MSAALGSMLKQFGTPNQGSRDIRGRRIDSSSPKTQVRDRYQGKFPKTIEAPLRACRSAEKLNLNTENSAFLRNRSISSGKGVVCVSSDDEAPPRLIDKVFDKLWAKGRKYKKKDEGLLAGKNSVPILTKKFKKKAEKSTIIQATQPKPRPEFGSPKRWEGRIETKEGQLKRQKSVDNDKRRKKDDLDKYNEKIRKMNAELAQQKSPQRKSKKKNLREYIVLSPGDKALMRQKSPPKEGLTTTERRKRIGAEFLSSLETDRVKAIVKKHQEKKNPVSPIVSILLPQSPSQLTRVGSFAGPGFKQSRKNSEVPFIQLPQTLKQQIGQIMMQRKGSMGKDKSTAKLIVSKQKTKIEEKLENRAKSPKQTMPKKKKSHPKKFVDAQTEPEYEYEMPVRLHPAKGSSETPSKSKNKNRSRDESHDIERDLNRSIYDGKRFSVSSDDRDDQPVTLPPKGKDSSKSRSKPGDSIFPPNPHMIPGQPGKKSSERLQTQMTPRTESKPVSVPRSPSRSSRDSANPEAPVRLGPESTHQKSDASIIKIQYNINSPASKQQSRNNRTEGHLTPKESLVVIDRSEESPKKVDECIQVQMSMETIPKSEVKEMISEPVPPMQPLSQVPSMVTPNLHIPIQQSGIPVQQLAKDEYLKWTQARNMVLQIEEKLGLKVAAEVKEMLDKLDLFATHSKRNLKEAFLVSEALHSNPLSEIRTRRSEDVPSVQVDKQLLPPNTPQDKPASASSYQKVKTFKRGEIDVWPDMAKSSSGSPKSIHRQACLFSVDKPKLKETSKEFHSGTSEFHSDRVKGQKLDKPLLGASLAESKKHGPDHTLESKIKVIDQFEAKAEQPPNNPTQNEQQPITQVVNPPLVEHVQPSKGNDRLTKSVVDLARSDISPMLRDSNLMGPDMLSYISSGPIPDKESMASPRQPDIIPEDVDSQHKDAEIVLTTSNPGSPIPKNKDMFDVPPLANAGLSDLKGTPGSKDEQGFLGESSSRNNLKKYVETPSVDMNWLISEMVGNNPNPLTQGSPSQLKRESSFDEEVKSCRKQFLAETITEFILNQLISELRGESLYFKQLPQVTEQRVNLNLLEDPRYISESSEEDTIYGIRTNMNAVFEYCNLLVRFILDNYMDLLLEKFNQKRYQDITRTLIDIRDRDEALQSTNSHWVDFAKGKLKSRPRETFFPEFIFTSLEDEIISNYDNMNIMQNLFDMQKIYHRSIFDCFNEIVTDKWLNDLNVDSYQVVVHKKNYKSRSLMSVAELEQLIVTSKDQVVEYSTMMCGIIRDKEDSLIGNLKLMSPERIDLIREERLFRFLCFEAIEMEKTFTDYSTDEVSALVQCGVDIFDTLITEVVTDLISIREKRQTGFATLS